MNHPSQKNGDNMDCSAFERVRADYKRAAKLFKNSPSRLITNEQLCNALGHNVSETTLTNNIAHLRAHLNHHGQIYNINNSGYVYVPNGHALPRGLLPPGPFVEQIVGELRRNALVTRKRIGVIIDSQKNTAIDMVIKKVRTYLQNLRPAEKLVYVQRNERGYVLLNDDNRERFEE